MFKMAAALFLLLLALPLIAEAQCVTRTRPCFAAPVVTPVFRPAVVVKKVVAPEVVLVPKAVPVAVVPEFYFSVGDAYRDALLADAIAYRVLSAMQGKAAPAQVVPRAPLKGPPAPPPAPGPDGGAPQKTDVPKGLQEVVTASCIKCHAGVGAAGNNGIGLDDLSVISEAQRWKSYGLVNSGEMPKGKDPIKDEEVKLFYDWAKLAKRGGK